MLLRAEHVKQDERAIPRLLTLPLTSASTASTVSLNMLDHVWPLQRRCCSAPADRYTLPRRRQVSDFHSSLLLARLLGSPPLARLPPPRFHRLEERRAHPWRRQVAADGTAGQQRFLSRGQTFYANTAAAAGVAEAFCSSTALHSSAPHHSRFSFFCENI